MKNRKLEICTSGSVGGRGGNTPTYPARRGLKASEHEERSERRPSLTGAARDGQYDVRAGTKERAPQGPNKRTGPRKETGCRQIM